MPTGTVKWFDVKKGYGFIIGPAGEDVFVHFTSIIGDGFRCLRDGESVDYELVRSDKGLQARKVRRLPVEQPPPCVLPAAGPTQQAAPPGGAAPPGT